MTRLESNVRNLRRMAELMERVGNPERALELRKEAEELTKKGKDGTE